MLKRFVHGSAVDDPIVQYEAASFTDRRHLFTDWQGSIVGTADVNGASIGINSYDEYGIPGASNSGRFQYTGQAWLPELGMYYYKARIYSPTLGRFMQTDPIGYDDGMNIYAYVGNDPVNKTDPTGTKKLKWFVQTVTGAWKRVTGKQAKSSREAEKNIRNRGPGQVGAGKRLEEKVQGGKGRIVKHGPHPGGRPQDRGTKETHFQPRDRKTGGKGHTFVGRPAAGAATAAIAGAMRDVADEIGTASDQLTPQSSAHERNAAARWDFFDPASNIADTLRTAADIIEPERQ